MNLGKRDKPESDNEDSIEMEEHNRKRRRKIQEELESGKIFEVVETQLK